MPRHAEGPAHLQTLFPRQPPRHRERLLIRDLDEPVDHREVDRLGVEVLTYSLHRILVDLGGILGGEDRAIWVGPHHEDVGALLLEEPTASGDRAPGPDPAHQRADLAIGLAPYLWTSGPLVGSGVLGVRVLVGVEGAGDLAGQPAGDPVI